MTVVIGAKSVVKKPSAGRRTYHPQRLQAAIPRPVSGGLRDRAQCATPRPKQRYHLTTRSPLCPRGASVHQRERSISLLTNARSRWPFLKYFRLDAVRDLDQLARGEIRVGEGAVSGELHEPNRNANCRVGPAWLSTKSRMCPGTGPPSMSHRVCISSATCRETS